ncbi:hypothetical protein G9A89_009231 [Geosiphon pyriformis]|nr:hypothetical protein G9A89_009231 [Geosiphon pyriformis]
MNVPAKQEDIIRWHMILNNNILIVTETKLRSSVKSWITNKFPGVRVFTSGLNTGFLGADVTLIMNENLAKHVSKISEILGRLLIVYLLFKNKQSVSVLGLYAEASWDRHTIQAGLINFFIARTCNESTFVILSGDFNKNGNKHSSSFSKCVDFGLVNALSLSNALINGQVVDMDKFFNTDHSSVQITIGLGGILDPVLKAICVQANRDKLKLLVSKLVKASCSVLSNEFVSLLDIWVSLDSINASTVKSLFLLGSHFDAIRSALAKIRKYYHSLKMIESKCAQDFQIKLAFDKRIENFGLNKDQTIRSVLEKPFYKVTLNHLVVNENLILKPGLVKFHINRIMEEWTRKCIVVGNVNEFFGMVLDLPDNKAAGLSEETWVSMIPKLYNWKGVFINTQPIVLIETVCKILSKILFDRIFLVCNKYDVLRGDNFSVLKGMTTQSSIFAIGLVVKDALEKNCKLWLVLQNMKKAYDSVG